MASLLDGTSFSLSSWHKENLLVQTLCWWAIHTVDPGTQTMLFQSVCQETIIVLIPEGHKWPWRYISVTAYLSCKSVKAARGPFSISLVYINNSVFLHDSFF